MSMFWKAFFSVFGGGFTRPRRNIIEPAKMTNWYHRGPWWEHPYYKSSYKEER